MLGIAIHCIQHSQAMLERGVCELAHSFFHLSRLISGIFRIAKSAIFYFVRYMFFFSNLVSLFSQSTVLDVNAIENMHVSFNYAN